MSARRLTAAAVAALWLTAAAPAVPQGAGGVTPAAAGFAERIDVELINVDVWVSDRRGEPVTGLTAEDFEIQHDGRPVPISHFTEIRESAEARDPDRSPAAGSPPAASPTAFFPSHVVAYFDQSRLHPRNYPALLRSLEEFLAAGEVPPERVMILRQERSLFVEAPFGSTGKELREALDRVTRGASGGLDLEAETQLALDAIRSSWEQSQDALGAGAGGISAIPDVGGGGPPGSGGTAGGSPRSVVGGVGSGAGPDSCGPFFSLIQPILDGFARSRGQRIGVTLSNLSDAAGFLAGLPGVKALLYLSDGLDTQPGAALASYAGGLCPARSADILSSALSEELTAPFLTLTRHANANRVTIYSLQASGLRSPGVSDASSGRDARGGRFQSRGSFESSQRLADREGLRLIADETGGRTIFNTNELGPELARIGRDLGTYYSLAYAPPADAGKGREHRIEVRLRDGSLNARYRRGYVDKDDDQKLTERIEGALNLGLVSNPLAVRLGAGDVRAAPGAEGTFRMPLHVMVPVESLAFLPSGDAFVAEVTVRAMSRHLGSSALVVHDKSFRIKGSPEATGWANLTLELELGEGAHLTALGVRDNASRQASFVSATFQVGPGG